MKILNINQIREADKFTIENEPVASIDLMERAARRCTESIKKIAGNDKNIKIFAGKGNNGGDGLAIARLLHIENYPVQTYLLSDELSPDAQQNYQRLREVGHEPILIFSNNFPEIKPDEIVVDAILGSGLTHKVNGMIGEIIKTINNSGATILSIDVPSGLFCDLPVEDSNLNEILAVQAHKTLTFEFPKLSFLFSQTSHYVGKFEILPIGLHREYIKSAETHNYYIDIELIKSIIVPRQKFAHKGVFGHALLAAGSYGKMGAAVLAAKSCLRSGVGLLTVHLPKLGYEIMQTVVPEAMVSIDKYDKLISELPNINNFNALGIGPGIGKGNATLTLLKTILDSKFDKGLVIDADALNLLGENRELLNQLNPKVILTPHPKEFERLAGKSQNCFDQYKKLIAFAKQYQTNVVLKGMHTIIATSEGDCYFNSTGNPGMSTAGSGDVLTGIILSFLAQGFSPKNAAIAGVYVHGLAGDIYSNCFSQNSLIATDIIEYLGTAFNYLSQ